MRARPKEDDARKDEEIRKFKQKVGELVMDIDVFNPNMFIAQKLQQVA